MCSLVNAPSDTARGVGTLGDPYKTWNLLSSEMYLGALRKDL